MDNVMILKVKENNEFNRLIGTEAGTPIRSVEIAPFEASVCSTSITTGQLLTDETHVIDKGSTACLTVTFGSAAARSTHSHLNKLNGPLTGQNDMYSSKQAAIGALEVKKVCNEVELAGLQKCIEALQDSIDICDMAISFLENEEESADNE